MAAPPFTDCETRAHRLTQGPGEEVEGQLFSSAVDLVHSFRPPASEVNTRCPVPCRLPGAPSWPGNPWESHIQGGPKDFHCPPSPHICPCGPHCSSTSKDIRLRNLAVGRWALLTLTQGSGQVMCQAHRNPLVELGFDFRPPPTPEGRPWGSGRPKQAHPLHVLSPPYPRPE